MQGQQVSDHARLECLSRLGLEAMPDPEIFSRITKLTTAMLSCPVALVSIVDDKRQWFLGRTGFPLPETALDVSFCVHCVDGGEPVLVTDARADPRFSANSLVTGEPYIRSYLGVPIRFEAGEVLGSLCAISPERGAFDESHVEPLTMLAQLVEQNIALYARTRELTRRNATLHEAARVFRHAEMAANIGFWRIDLASGMINWSDQAHLIHGLEPDRKPLTTEQALGFYSDEDRAAAKSRLETTGTHGAPMKFETHITRTDGALRRVRVIGERIETGGQPDCIAGIVQDCTDEYLSHLALQRAAQHDRLTGLFNRAEFDRRLGIAMQAAERGGVTVAVLDLDGFKEINDTLGHLAGDQVLASLAARFQRIIGPDVFLARWGGDEFALLFPPGTPLDAAIALADRLIAETRLLSGESPQFELLGATCGIARVDSIVPGEEVIRRADLALYRGKQEATGTVMCWDETLDARQSARKAAVLRLRHALDEGEAFAAYQPIIDLDTGRVSSFEALLRLSDGQGGVLEACEIFSALLDPVLSRRVSQMMIRQLVRDGPQLLAAFGADCRIGINLSEADLREGDFAQQVLDLIADSPLEPFNLTIEVTETMLLSDETGGLRSSLVLLNQAGCTIALDDFGTGFSSLSNLRRFPIRKLKIDREFIASIESDSQSRMIIQAIVEMGRGLGLRVVAEGVETAAQEDFLRQIGCTHVQGYRYSRPMPVGDWLVRQKPASLRQRRRA